MPPLDELTILVPVDISGPETPTLDILDLFGPIEVVLLGYFLVPVQAEPALIRDEYEAAAEEKLVELAEGRPDLTEVLVFTHDRNATVDRVADEYACDAVLTTGDTDHLDRILVPVRGDVNLDRIVSVVAGLLAAGEATATLFHSVAEDAEPSQGEFLLRGAAGRLADFGIDEARIDWRLSERGDPLTEITELATEYDLVVFGETEPSLRERIVGDVLARIIDGIDAPALVVRDVE